MKTIERPRLFRQTRGRPAENLVELAARNPFVGAPEAQFDRGYAPETLAAFEEFSYKLAVLFKLHAKQRQFPNARLLPNALPHLQREGAINFLALWGNKVECPSPRRHHAVGWLTRAGVTLVGAWEPIGSASASRTTLDARGVAGFFESDGGDVHARVAFRALGDHVISKLDAPEINSHSSAGFMGTLVFNKILERPAEVLRFHGGVEQALRNNHVSNFFAADDQTRVLEDLHYPPISEA